MSNNFDSPVQTQMAIAVLKTGLSTECHGNLRVESKPVGRRRVFVQTETGCVLGLELDRSDNAHTVKRKLQLALHVPTDGSSLTFGDLVLKNDLTVVRNDFPLLLTRNFMHRSSSTPCLLHMVKDMPQRDKSRPIEIIGCSTCSSSIKFLVKDISKAIKCEVEPIPVRSGMGGAYYFRNVMGENVAIVKPTDEEPFAPNNPKGFVGKALGQPGLKRSVRVGETGFREVAAYLLDYEHFANVPPTILVKITHSIFNINGGVDGSMAQERKPASKIASLQQFIHHDFDASDHGTSSFPVSAVHRIGILDIRIFNTDRHAGNLLVRKLDKVGRFGEMDLIPIDHGLCLPEGLEDPYFEWIHWPQASIPFSDDELEYIAILDPIKDAEMLRNELPMIREACLRVLVLSTIFLKEAASFGLCLAEIGELMSREFSGFNEEPSELEMLCIEARNLLTEREFVLPNEETNEEQEFQFDIDCENSDDFLNKPPYHFVSNLAHRRTSLSRLDEEESEESTFKGIEEPIRNGYTLKAPKLSISLNNVGLSERTSSQYHGSSGDCPSTSRSASQPFPPSVSFVNLSDLSEDQWAIFLDKFQGLLPRAFADRKCGVSGSRSRQRLGTSCQF